MLEEDRLHAPSKLGQRFFFWETDEVADKNESTTI
jgi:hypothetical protein